MYVLKLRNKDDPEGQLMAVAHSENLQSLVEWLQKRIAQEVRVVIEGNSTKIGIRFVGELESYKVPDNSKPDEGIQFINADIQLTERVRAFEAQERMRIEESIQLIVNNTIKVN